MTTTVMHLPVLNNTGLNTQLLQQGFVTLPFLNSHEVKQLQDLFYQYTDTSTIGKGLYSNLYNRTGDENWHISTAMENICSSAFARHFTNAALNGGVFIAKGNFAETQCNLHQDYTNTNESTGATYALWIPLCDINGQTGLFNVIPGSHRLRSHIRAISNASFYIDLDKVKPEKIEKLQVKAGEAVVFDHALIHGSQPNVSGHLRIAAVMGVLPQGVAYEYYLKTGDNSFAVYALNKELYIRHFGEQIAPGKLPAQNLLRNITAPVTIDGNLLNNLLK